MSEHRLIPVYNSRGDVEAFLVFPYLFNRNGEWIGCVTPQREVYSVLGNYVGSLTNDPNGSWVYHRFNMATVRQGQLCWLDYEDLGSGETILGYKIRTSASRPTGGLMRVLFGALVSAA